MLKDNLLRVFREFHNNGNVNQRTHATFITLVLKKSETNESHISDL